MCCYRYGYPDYTYLSRVRSELAAKGIGISSTSAEGTNTASTASTYSTRKSRKSTAGSHVPASDVHTTRHSRILWQFGSVTTLPTFKHCWSR